MGLTTWSSNLEMSLPAVMLLAAWVLTLISIPILQRRWGDRALTTGVAAGVVLQAAAVVAIVAPAWGPGPTLRVALVVVVLGWLAEFVGSRTGVPFGRYSYTTRLQPQLGRVPLLIPVAWLMMLPPAWAVGSAWAAGLSGASEHAAFVLASALAFTAWDLFLDPQMVSWGLWTWSEVPQGPRYFGIPWINFAGWFGVAALITWVAVPADAVAWLRQPGPALLLVYALTWMLETVGQLAFWKLPGPAASGAAAMGLCLLVALRRDLAGPALWTVLAFVSGALPFSLWVGRLALKTDIRAYGDGNPGATNVLRAGSKGAALLAAFLDMLKGALPVALAYVVAGMRGFEIVPVALAPVVGHMLSPFLGGRGGKGVAVTGGVWIGLTGGVGAAIGTAAMTLATVVQTVAGWSVTFGMLAIGAYLAIWKPDPVLLTVWAGNLALLLWRHRQDFRQPPRLRHRDGHADAATKET